MAKRSLESAASGRAVLRGRVEGAWFEKTKRLAEYLDQEADTLRSQGFPVGSGMRIDMERFREVPEFASRLDRDKKYVEDLESRFYPGTNQNQRREKRLRSYSEAFELLKTAVMHRGIGDRFVVARSSRFDDIKNGIDNVIVDRQTGHIVGALDEVGETNGPAVQEKKRDIASKNQRGGAELYYAFQIFNRDGQESISLGNARDVPIFLLSLNQELIHRGLDHLDTSRREPGDVEQRLLAYFLSLVSSQIHEIELYEDYVQLSEVMRGNIANLKTYLESRKAGAKG